MQATIYQIKREGFQEFYIGSTADFERRRRCHKSRCNNKAYIHPVYQFIRDNGGWEYWDMVRICDVRCQSKTQIHKIERQFIEEWGSSLNQRVPTRTNKEYYSVNRDYFLTKSRRYYEKNKALRCERQSERVQCDCGSVVRRDKVARHKRSQKHIKFTRHYNFILSNSIITNG